MQVSLKLSIAKAHPQILSEVTIPMHPKSFYCQHHNSVAERNFFGQRNLLTLNHVLCS